MTDKFKILKPCPFCGGVGILSHVDGCKWKFQVVCQTCYAKTDVLDSEKQTIKAWNKRVPQRTATMQVYDSFGGEVAE